MTPEQLDIVASTAAVVKARPAAFASAFYDRLFELAPAARSLFPDDPTAQGRMLAEELVLLAQLASDFDGFVARARALGARYCEHGVRSHDYDAMGEALLVALDHVLGDACTPHVVGAWRRLHHLIAETMMERSGSDLFASS